VRLLSFRVPHKEGLRRTCFADESFIKDSAAFRRFVIWGRRNPLLSAAPKHKNALASGMILAACLKTHACLARTVNPVMRRPVIKYLT
jgi:hypothetical protein